MGSVWREACRNELGLDLCSREKENKMLPEKSWFLGGRLSWRQLPPLMDPRRPGPYRSTVSECSSKRTNWSTFSHRAPLRACWWSRAILNGGVPKSPLQSLVLGPSISLSILAGEVKIMQSGVPVDPEQSLPRSFSGGLAAEGEMQHPSSKD